MGVHGTTQTKILVNEEQATFQKRDTSLQIPNVASSASVHKVHFGDHVNFIEKLLGSEISSMHDVEVDLQIVGIFGGITYILPNVIPV